MDLEKLKQDIEAYKQSEQEANEIIAELKAELQKYKDMEAKGLEEFKDVGGCWGCGLQSQLNQDMEDIKRLKVQKDKYYQQTLDDEIKLNELYQTLQEIKEIAEGHTELCKQCEQQRKECDCGDICNAYRLEQILQKISEVME